MTRKSEDVWWLVWMLITFPFVFILPLLYYPLSILNVPTEDLEDCRYVRKNLRDWWYAVRQAWDVLVS
jgi:hypothetical protein